MASFQMNLYSWNQQRKIETKDVAYLVPMLPTCFPHAMWYMNWEWTHNRTTAWMSSTSSKLICSCSWYCYCTTQWWRFPPMLLQQRILLCHIPLPPPALTIVFRFLCHEKDENRTCCWNQGASKGSKRGSHFGVIIICSQQDTRYLFPLWLDCPSGSHGVRHDNWLDHTSYQIHETV